LTYSPFTEHILGGYRYHMGKTKYHNNLSHKYTQKRAALQESRDIKAKNWQQVQLKTS